jgi:hypothetical protein
MKRYFVIPAVLCVFMILFFSTVNPVPASGAESQTSPMVNESVDAEADDLYESERQDESEAPKARLTLIVSPSGAGTTKPERAKRVRVGKTVPVMAKAALGWSFAKWTVRSGKVEIDNAKAAMTGVRLQGDGVVEAHFKPGSSFTLSTSVYPDGAGSVTPSSSSWNHDDVIDVSAKAASKDFIFYKWECSKGCEIINVFTENSQIRLKKNAKAESVALTAHFLSREEAKGSATFQASYEESIGETRIAATNKAAVNMKFNNALRGVLVDKKTSFTAMFGSGLAITEHTVSDDPHRVVNLSSGSAKFVDRGVGAKKTATLTEVAWKNGSFSLDYVIKPKADHNIADLYSLVYKKGKGSWIPIKASQTQLGGIPALVVVENDEWAVMCISPKGLDFSGKGKSRKSERVHDDLVSWEVEGTGNFIVYKWISPRESANNSVTGRATGGALASRVEAAAAPRAPIRSQSSDMQKEADNDPRVTTFQVPTLIGRLPGDGTRAPFFYGGKVYSVARSFWYPNGAYLNIGRVDENGKYIHETTVLTTLGETEYGFGYANNWTTCVFKGEAFLYYAAMTPDGKRFNIYGCSTTAPEKGWKNLGWMYYMGEKVYGIRNTDLGADSRQCPVKALVFNGRIYLIFTAANGAFTFISSKDGKTWEWGGVINDAWSWQDKFMPQFNACVVTKNGVPTLCVVILGTEQYKDWCYIRFYDSENKLIGGYHKYMDWVASSGGIAVSPGSVKGSIQGSVVQIFGSNSAWSPAYLPPRRLALDVDSGASQGWTDVPISGLMNALGGKDSVEVSVPDPNSTTNDLRKYVLLFNERWYTWFGFGDEWVDVASYESDYFKGDAEESKVNTASPENADPKAWWLMGVVEGVPPFTRNGDGGESSVSDVKYAQEASSSEGSETVFEGEVYAQTGFDTKVGDANIEGGISLKQVFSVSSEYEKSINLTSDVVSLSSGVNKDGAKGVLLYAKPTIKSRKYTWLSQDKKYTIGTYSLLHISSIVIDSDEYDLESPPEGMAKRKPSTDLNYWMNERGDLPAYDPKYLVRYNGDSMVVSDMRPGKGSIEKKVVKGRNVSSSTKLEISGKYKMLLTLEGSASSTLEFKSFAKQATSESVNVAVDPLPSAKASGDVKKYIIDWAWYLPADNSNMEDMKKIPEWVPKSAWNQAQAPWCLTWKVVDIVRKP